MPHQADLCEYLKTEHNEETETEAEQVFLQELCNLVAGVSSQYFVSHEGVYMHCFGHNCKGTIHVQIDPDNSNITWGCNRCHEHGTITNWGQSFYNCLGMQEDIKH